MLEAEYKKLNQFLRTPRRASNATEPGKDFYMHITGINQESTEMPMIVRWISSVPAQVFEMRRLSRRLGSDKIRGPLFLVSLSRLHKAMDPCSELPGRWVELSSHKDVTCSSGCLGSRFYKKTVIPQDRKEAA